MVMMTTTHYATVGLDAALKCGTADLDVAADPHSDRMSPPSAAAIAWDT